MQPGQRIRCTPCQQRVHATTSVCSTTELGHTVPRHCLEAQGWIKATSGSWWCPACARENGVTKEVHWHMVFCQHRQAAAARDASAGTSAQSTHSGDGHSGSSAGRQAGRSPTPPRIPPRVPPAGAPHPPQGPDGSGVDGTVVTAGMRERLQAADVLVGQLSEVLARLREDLAALGRTI